MQYDEAKKELAKIIKSLAPVHSLHSVFRDFTTLASCTISNSIDKLHWQDREDLYLKTIQKYSKDECNLFADMFALTTAGLESRMGDFLGETYMELEIGNKHAGQFFTPYNVAKLMAEMTVESSIEKINKNGYVTVNEPAVGGGVTIIALAESLKERKYSYQTQLKVVCNDIDHDLARMCYVQLSLLGIDAVVMQQNTLSTEIGNVYYTPIHLINKAKEKQHEKLNKFKNVADKLKEIEQSKQKGPVIEGQMSIFDMEVVAK